MPNEERDLTSSGDQSIALTNGRLGRAHDVTIPASDPGFVRGDGVFDVFRLYGNIPFALDHHLARLSRSAAAIHLSYDTQTLRDECERICGLASPDRLIRIILTRDGLRLLIEELNPVFPEQFSLLTIPHLVSPLIAGVKSLSYGVNMHAHRLALESGCDTALFVNPDSRRILEAPFMSFAWSEGGQLFTPPLPDGILDGITRRVLLASFRCEERSCTPEDLERADGAAVLGTGFEMRPVSRISGLINRTLSNECTIIRAACTEVKATIKSSVECHGGRLQKSMPVPSMP